MSARSPTATGVDPRNPKLSRRGRVVALVGALTVVGGAAYLTATAVNVNTPSLLQNQSARTPGLGYAAGALAVAIVTAIVVARRRDPGAGEGAVLVVIGVALAALGTEAVAQSDREVLLPTLALAVYLPAALLIGGGCVLCATHSREALVGGMALVVGLTGVLAATLLVERSDEAVVALGLHEDWEQVTEVDKVFVDGAGHTWGVRPWEQAAPATLSLQESGTFRETADRRPAWPPTVLGSDASGTTWIVFSEIDDPFQPVFETYRDGQFSTVPSPASPLPPLDAVVLDGARTRLLGIHSDFAVPSSLVLEVFEAGRWRTEPTPMTTPGRATSVDMAVDSSGRVWVWHDSDPTRIQRYDGTIWTAVPLPFDLETTTDLDAPPISIDAFRTFFADANGALWLYDRDGSQLVAIDETGASGPRPLPAGCTPLTFDFDGRIWCGTGDGLVIVDVDGTSAYDSRDDDLHEFEPVDVAVGPDKAWLLVRRDDRQQLLAFQYRDGLNLD
ncbi:MAG: hypothetical protein M3179_14090 [Actinomycetota bacterium]|nr:hypothetical protein [Actinomycetota bacterium]